MFLCRTQTHAIAFFKMTITRKPKKTILKHIEISGRKLLMKFFALLQPRNTFDSLPDNYRPGKVLFMRQDKLGDMAVTLPFFRAIQTALPDTEIVVLSSNINDILLKYEKDFKKIIYRKHPLYFLKSLWQVFALHPDIILDLQLKESATSTIYVLASRAKWRIRPQRNIKLPFNIYIDIGDDWHIQHEMAKLFGVIAPIDVENERTDVRISADEEAFAIKFFSKISEPKHKLVGLNISAGKPERELTIEENANIAKGLIERGFKPIIIYSPADEAKAKKLAIIVKGINIAPKTPTVLHVIALLPYFHAIITPDTSVVHLASGIRVPMVALYNAFFWNMNRWLPRGVPYRGVVSKDHQSIAGIEVEDILAKFDELILELEQDS